MDQLMVSVCAGANEAEAIQIETGIGNVGKGLFADIIAVDENPLVDITALQRVVFVMKGGKIYRSPG